mmetsp:Transcript_46220/g.114614  ORF Transcript_46220/g.114614 Transcript_46220/m.114614 type:complete len:211 (+) Transcript_46220:1751-2383(+)
MPLRLGEQQQRRGLAHARLRAKPRGEARRGAPRQHVRHARRERRLRLPAVEPRDAGHGVARRRRRNGRLESPRVAWPRRERRLAAGAAAPLSLRRRGVRRRNVYSRPVGAQCGGMPRCCSREASGWTWRDGRNERTDYWNPGGQAVVDNVVDNRKTQGAHVSAAMIPFSERLGQWLNTLPPYVCVLSLILIIGALHLDGIQCLIERVTGE